ncbi:MAG: T9SS type A sorting domain-containing protein [Bacteroidales bacterium]|nr:T9SS type A sorting domain-containing protein [Bacteroidales bacterium]
MKVNIRKIIILSCLFIGILSVNAQWKPLEISVDSWMFSDVFFLNKDTGYVAGHNQSGLILKTTDGGLTWSDKSNGIVSNFLFAPFFVNVDTGYVAGLYGCFENYIFKTTDGGENWELQNTGIYNNNIIGVYFSSADSGFAMGTLGEFIQTTDGGTTWNLMQTNISDAKIYDVQFVNKDIMFAVGAELSSKGLILKSNDGGRNWEKATLPIKKDAVIQSIASSNADTAYAVGFYWNNDTGLILKTNDGGSTWIEIKNRPVGIYNSVHFFNSTIGYIVGYDVENDKAIIIATKNGGESWDVQQTSEEDGEYYDVFAIDEQIAYTVGRHGFGGQARVILKTTNGGNDPSQIIESNIDNIYVYPNPFNDYISVYNPLFYSIQELVIFDVFGKRIQILSAINQTQVNIHLTHLNKGLYFVKIQTDKGISIHKLIKN